MRSCSNFRGMKVVSHTMKIWERVVEAMISEQQYSFMLRKSTTEVMFALVVLM